MKPLQQIVRAGHCHATHQLFAIDALPLVQTDSGKRLVSWFLRYHHRYLRGAIDPDIRVRDFQNHVIHVQDGFWGGAPRVAHSWYDRLQRYLRQKRYSDAAHAAGVLSHYFTDPMQPLNTAYSTAEEVIHRPLSCSIQRDYQAIFNHWRDDDLRVVFQLADGPGWLGAAMMHGAKYAHKYFDTVIELYRLRAAVEHPSTGIDSRLRVIFAELFGLAITGWARVIERAADDAEAVIRRELPTASSFWPLLSATAAAPVAFWRHRIRSRIEDQKIQDLVSEFRRKGKLQKELPAEVDIKKRVIKVHRDERRYRLGRIRQRRQITLQQAESPVLPFQHLLSPPRQPIELLAIDAEDLKRLRAVGVNSLDELLIAEPAEIAKQLQAYWITGETIQLWQNQAKFMRQASGLASFTVQLLLGAGFADPRQVIRAGVDKVHQQVVAFAASTPGRRSLRGQPPPTREQVSRWFGQIMSADVRKAA